MLAVSTSLIGASILGLVALLASLRTSKKSETPGQRLFRDMLKMVTAGGLATGLVLVAVSVTKIAHFGSDSAELALMLGVPVMALMLLRVLQGWSQAEATSHRLQARVDA